MLETAWLVLFCFVFHDENKLHEQIFVYALMLHPHPHPHFGGKQHRPPKCIRVLCREEKEELKQQLEEVQKELDERKKELSECNYNTSQTVNYCYVIPFGRTLPIKSLAGNDILQLLLLVVFMEWIGIFTTFFTLVQVQ